jgi:hypothetical protein
VQDGSARGRRATSYSLKPPLRIFRADIVLRCSRINAGGALSMRLSSRNGLSCGGIEKAPRSSPRSQNPVGAYVAHGTFAAGYGWSDGR